MVDGGKKDAEFIMEYFSNKMDEFDPTGLFPDCFFLMGRQMFKKPEQSFVQNIQGPCLFIEGGMCYLFFSDLAKFIQLR